MRRDDLENEVGVLWSHAENASVLLDAWETSQGEQEAVVLNLTRVQYHAQNVVEYVSALLDRLDTDPVEE